MPLFPKRIDLDEASLKQLRQLFKAATNDLRGIVFHVGSQDVTIVNVQQARALIQQRINSLQNDIGVWAVTNINGSYDKAIQDTINQLQSYRHPVTDQVAAGIIAGSVLLDRLHKTAADSLSTELQGRLSSAVTQMGRSTDQTVSQLLRDNIKQKLATPEATASPRAARQQVLKAFDETGVYALVDKSGKRWAPDVYADMTSRTIMAKAHTTAIGNALSSQNYDLVQVSSHGAIDACGPFEGAFLSLSGKTPGYLTVDDATAAGLFHVNCQHNIAPADPTDMPSDALPAEVSIDEL